MTMLLTASVIVFGILAFKQLAVNDLPAVDYPVIQVSVNYPGANPETMANTDRHAPGEAVHANPRHHAEHQLEHAGPDKHHAAVRALEKRGCRGH